MSEWNGMVWIVECDHEPMVIDGRVVSFTCGADGTNALRAHLNTLPTNDGHYYDGVLYESRQRKNQR